MKKPLSDKSSLLRIGWATFLMFLESDISNDDKYRVLLKSNFQKLFEQKDDFLNNFLNSNIWWDFICDILKKLFIENLFNFYDRVLHHNNLISLSIIWKKFKAWIKQLPNLIFGDLFYLLGLFFCSLFLFFLLSFLLFFIIFFIEYC